jgi:hypothetical protein
MDNPGCAETEALVAGLLIGFVDIRSVWSMDHEPAGADGARQRPRLLVFANTATLHRLHGVPRVAGVEVFVVTDGDCVQSAWHGERVRGSLARWAWQQTSANEAFYDQARWAEDGTTVVRVRRRAQLVWRTPDEQK